MHNVSHRLHREIDRVADLQATMQPISYANKIIYSLVAQAVEEAIDLTNTSIAGMQTHEYMEYRRKELDLIIELSYYR